MTPEPKTPVQVARDLTEIVNLSVQLLDQAVNDANAAIDGTSLPGGRAMIALAPVGDTASQERRLELAEAAWLARAQADGRTRDTADTIVVTGTEGRPDLVADEDDTQAPALQLLRYWSEQYRWANAAVWDHIPTINTEAKFLHHLIDTGWLPRRDAERWAHLGRDINRARRHLESILHAGKHPERSRVVCNNPDCPKPHELIKTYGTDTTGTADRWLCTACRTRYDDDDYRRAYADQLRHDHAARYVLLPDAIATLKAQGRSEHTIRKWLAPPLRHTADQCAGCKRKWHAAEHDTCPACAGNLRPLKRGNPDAVLDAYCDTRTHKTYVWWPALWNLHLKSQNRRRAS
ncbi:hypothetical protein [Nocardioides ochotonae]|uniref:hypothetical protein n=1 Tax=Nocardioides ochotonae TaxID=2685869 RepID=UPI00140D9635|nr:hypothetical protein [Nocardioides ochotonae]